MLEEELILLIHRPWQHKGLSFIEGVKQVPQVEQAIIAFIHQLAFQFHIHAHISCLAQKPNQSKLRS